MTISMTTLMKRTFPNEMTSVPLWLNFKLVDKGGGKFSKPPISPFTGEVCSKTDEGMYTDFNRALVGVEQHDADGVGFVFLHGFIAIDLDNCFTEDGSLSEMASDVVDHFLPTFIEYSPSGKGLHIFCKGVKPNDRTRVTGLEVYSGANFVTVTGDKVPESGDKVLNMQQELNWLFDKYLPVIEPTIKPELITIDHGSKSVGEWLEIGLTHDNKFNRLYNDTEHADDESSHDMALMCKLAYWLNRDLAAMEECFFESPWVQTKDQYHIKKVDTRSDYLESTLNKAVAMVGSCASENERKVRNISMASLQIEETSSGDVILPISEYTDVANARAFATVYTQDLAFTEEWGWCYFNGINWEQGQYYRAQSCAIEFAENLMYVANEYIAKLQEECANEGCDPNSKTGKAIMAPATAFMKHAQKSNSEGGIRSMLKLAESMMKSPASLFDSNPWTLNTPNVVVDLRTGEAYPPAWNHFNSMMTNVSYEAEPENNGLWDAFLRQIFCDDEDLIRYMQLQWGAACVGKVYEENLLIANGMGSNGKSTCFNILKGVLGDYCASVNPDILMDKVNYEQQIAVAGIKGKRLVIGQETESGQKLSTASLKRMVSTDTIVGRVLNHGYIEFEPSHTTMLATNHLPKVKDDDEGTWRRLTVVPFNAVITRDEMITNYQDVLVAEDGAYILKWLVEGAKMFYENGCTYGEKPKAVIEASNDYRKNEMGSLEVYCYEKLVFFDPQEKRNTWVNPDELYADYTNWCMDNRIKPMSKINVSRTMYKKGVTSKPIRLPGQKPKRVWYNVQFKDEDVIE